MLLKIIYMGQQVQYSRAVTPETTALKWRDDVRGMVKSEM